LPNSATLKKWECLDSDIRLHFVSARRAGEASAFIGFRRDKLAEAVRNYHIPDFSNWQHPAAFEAASAPPTPARRDSARQAGWKKICAPASENKSERGSVSRSTFKHPHVPIYSDNFLSGEAAAGRRPALRLRPGRDNRE
jgi:hypothetical protein